MPDKKTVLNDDQLQILTEQIHEKIIQQYKRKFLGISVGFTVALGVIGYFGVEKLQDFAADKVLNKLLDEDFKHKIIRVVSDSLASSSFEILNQMKINKAKTDSILSEVHSQHEAVIEAATQEFGRTVEVLQKVRGRILRYK